MLSNERLLQHPDHAHKSRDVNTGHIMRGITPHNGGIADGKPSKLELMRADYQKKLLKEKEEKMIQLYEDNQRKVMTRLTRGGNVQSGAANGGDGKSVWEYINQRRRVESNRVRSTDSQYRQTKEASAQKEWPGKAERGGTLTAMKASAGRDRSQPLAPIAPPADAQELGSTVRSGIPQRLPVAATGRGDGNPFPGRPRLVKHTPLPPTNNPIVDNKNNGHTGDGKATQSPFTGHKFLPGRSPHIPQQQQQRLTTNRKPPSNLQGERLQSRGQEKLTDFQKWQAEQNQTRDERLKRLNNMKASNDVRKLSDDAPVEIKERSAAHKDVHEDVTGSNKSINEEADIDAKEKEIMEKIAQRQRELDKIRQEKEEEEKHKVDRQKKKEATERVRQKKLEEERKREEAKRVKQEENENRLEMDREDKRHKEEDKMRKEGEKRLKEEGKRRQQKEKRMFAHEKEDEGASTSETSSFQKEDGRNSRSVLSEDSPRSSTKPSASVPKPSGDPHLSKSKMDSTDPDERRLSLSDAYVYEQAAASYGAQVFMGDLAKCKLCGRSFLPDRLKKHQEACAKANKPRKEFDSAKKRLEGTELAKYAGKARRPEPPKKKSNWRAKHEEFIQSLRYAKKVTKCEMEGGDLRNLTPPPVSENPEYVPCPHCGRTFNEGAAERHIPRCHSLKTRPPPMNTRRK